jgi:hypothetical protein
MFEGNSAPKCKAMHVFMKWALAGRSIVACFATPTAVCRPLFQAEIFSLNTVLLWTARGTSRLWRIYCLIRCIGYRLNKIVVYSTTLIPKTLVFTGMNSLLVGNLMFRHKTILAGVVPNIFSIGEKGGDSVRAKSPTSLPRFSGGLANRNVDSASDAISNYLKFDIVRA